MTALCKSNKVNGKELIKLIQNDVEKQSGNERNVIENYPQLLYGIIVTLPDDLTSTIIKEYYIYILLLFIYLSLKFYGMQC